MPNTTYAPEQLPRRLRRAPRGVRGAHLERARDQPHNRVRVRHAARAMIARARLPLPPRSRCPIAAGSAAPDWRIRGYSGTSGCKLFRHGRVVVNTSISRRVLTYP